MRWQPYLVRVTISRLDRDWGGDPELGLAMSRQLAQRLGVEEARRRRLTGSAGAGLEPRTWAELLADPAVAADDGDLVGVVPARASGRPTTAPAATTQPWSTTAQSTTAPRSTTLSAKTHAVADHGAGLHDHTRTEHAAAHLAARRQRPGETRLSIDGRRRGRGRGPLRLPGEDRPARVAEEALVVGQQVLVRGEVGCGCPRSRQ